MPELPDVELYLFALRSRIFGSKLEGVRLATPFLLRSVEPPLDAAIGRTVTGLRRIGKRIVWELRSELPARERSGALGPRERPSRGLGGLAPNQALFLIFHLMIAGRFKWRERGTTVPKKVGLAAFDFAGGTLLLTEAATQKRASLHVVEGESALAAFDPGGLEPVGSSLEVFGAALQKESHTLKRALTDPHLFSGIGNAYSDEILHRAKLSPFKLTRQLTSDELSRLHSATLDTLSEWTRTLRAEAGDAFPEKVTAFHQGMAVHGRFGQPCPRCGTPVQRIVHGEHEVNYCPNCQTEGRLLADRALSKLLKDDWPKTLDEMERRLNRK